MIFTVHSNYFRNAYGPCYIN